MAISNNAPLAAEDFQAELRRMQAWLANGSMQPALEQMSDIARDEFLQNFQESRESGGTHWPPRKYEYPWPILIKTGHLMRSAISEAEAGHVERISARELATGTNVFYAGFHQYGTKKLPPRPFIEVSNEGVDRMEAALVSFVIDSNFGG